MAGVLAATATPELAGGWEPIPSCPPRDRVDCDPENVCSTNTCKTLHQCSVTNNCSTNKCETNNFGNCAAGSNRCSQENICYKTNNFSFANSCPQRNVCDINKGQTCPVVNTCKTTNDPFQCDPTGNTQCTSGNIVKCQTNDTPPGMASFVERKKRLLQEMRASVHCSNSDIDEFGFA